MRRIMAIVVLVISAGTASAQSTLDEMKELFNEQLKVAGVGSIAAAEASAALTNALAMFDAANAVAPGVALLPHEQLIYDQAKAVCQGAAFDAQIMLDKRLASNSAWVYGAQRAFTDWYLAANAPNLTGFAYESLQKAGLHATDAKLAGEAALKYAADASAAAQTMLSLLSGGAP